MSNSQHPTTRLLQARLAACMACEHYNGNTCEAMFPEGCCRTTWQRRMSDPASVCPLGLWTDAPEDREAGYRMAGIPYDRTTESPNLGEGELDMALLTNMAIATLNGKKVLVIAGSPNAPLQGLSKAQVQARITTLTKAVEVDLPAQIAALTEAVAQID